MDKFSHSKCYVFPQNLISVFGGQNKMVFNFELGMASLMEIRAKQYNPNVIQMLPA